MTAFVAGLVQAAIAEEWVHHSVHFYELDNLYFQYIKRHHRYHHSPKGHDLGFGLTSGVWDVVYGTRIPAEVRAAMYAQLGRKQGGGRRSASFTPPRA